MAITRRWRGNRTIRSSGPHPAEGGSFGTAAAVMSVPITAKSPFSNSQMSGHASHPEQCVPVAWGLGPMRFRNITPSSCAYRHISSQALFPYFEARGQIQSRHYCADCDSFAPGETRGAWPVDEHRRPTGTIVTHHDQSRRAGIEKADARHVVAHRGGNGCRALAAVEKSGIGDQRGQAG